MATAKLLKFMNLLGEKKKNNNAGECRHNGWWLTEFAKKPTNVLRYKKRISQSKTLWV
jgi:hypothetical protein